ncbi:MAG: hypothetical protein ACR2GN_06790 [Bacteroidia bacterium]
MKILIAAVLFVVSFQLVKAQTPALNAAKYENYRTRLLQEFMIDVGPAAGMSIPASIRDTVSGFIYWGDATIDLGYYIGVLATEYHLKLTSGVSTDSTAKELFYALQA